VDTWETQTIQEIANRIAETEWHKDEAATRKPTPEEVTAQHASRVLGGEISPGDCKSNIVYVGGYSFERGGSKSNPVLYRVARCSATGARVTWERPCRDREAVIMQITEAKPSRCCGPECYPYNVCGKDQMRRGGPAVSNNFHEVSPRRWTYGDIWTKTGEIAVGTFLFLAMGIPGIAFAAILLGAAVYWLFTGQWTPTNFQVEVSDINTLPLRLYIGVTILIPIVYGLWGTAWLFRQKRKQIRFENL